MPIIKNIVTTQKENYTCDSDNIILIFTGYDLTSKDGAYVHICPECNKIYNLPVKYPIIIYTE